VDVNKKVVYTAIYGDKDVLKNPIYKNENFDYVCFTDNKNIKSDFWTVIYKEGSNKDPVRSAKLFKAMPHLELKEYDISLWVDANFLIKGDLNSFLEKCNQLEDASMLLFQHDQGRNCIYDEGLIILQHKKDNPLLVQKQMEKYEKENYPTQRGLSANSIMLRKHNKKEIIKLSDMWWDEISNFSRRDQLSLYYCIWKLDVKHYLLKYPNIDIRNNEWFQWLPHNYESQGWF
jgi:hypothetical protein